MPSKQQAQAIGTKQASIQANTSFLSILCLICSTITFFCPSTSAGLGANDGAAGAAETCWAGPHAARQAHQPATADKITVMMMVNIWRGRKLLLGGAGVAAGVAAGV
eukprot:CAMPEP_0173444404 /NCGR_PEP_ID=MMETSP1357-20121228/32108_1 /TAXON_ID=77926 /ORGANISM="Hemiselmis rufescens, Strain PCC563" /LENGTH=106 /DNA_ID=CAMNT_0014410449 /DNA_START=269 /DNA_END=585 /DNA_ORIENTATION=+